MVVELAAVRLLAPWFGASLVVWTNVIAVILLALALGYLLGGRLAARTAPLRSLGAVLLLAGFLVAWLPLVGAAIARSLLPEHLALHEAAALVAWGSLAVSLLVFLPPAALLGMVSPLVVEDLARANGLSPGRAGGLVLCISTLGSLAGVFATSHLLLPVLGLRHTFFLAGGLLFCAGLLAAPWRSRRGRAAGVALLVGGAPAPFLAPATPSLPEGFVELARLESPYQSLRVVEDRGANPNVRWLQVNEGFDSFQSVWQPNPGLLPDGYYYNDFLLPLSWREGSGPWSVLVLGFGAGTVARVFAGESADTRVHGVELDPGVLELGRLFFDLGPNTKALEVLPVLDARVAMRASADRFDQLVLDCYSNQVEIPAHLCTVEFFREVRAHLADDGWLTANLGGFDLNDPVVDAVARSCATAFDTEVLLVRVPLSRNFLLLARRGGALPWAEGSLLRASRESSLVLGPRRLPTFTRMVSPCASKMCLTDDRCPIEKLQLRSLREAQARRQAGTRS